MAGGYSIAQFWQRNHGFMKILTKSTVVGVAFAYLWKRSFDRQKAEWLAYREDYLTNPDKYFARMPPVQVFYAMDDDDDDDEDDE